MGEEKKIKRFDIMSNAHDSWFVEREHGNYVSYSDYRRLEAEKAELIQALKSAAQNSEKHIIKLFTEARDKYHNFFMSRGRISMLEQIEHDKVMEHYNFAIEFLQSYNER